jgi:hypothetical protein
MLLISEPVFPNWAASQKAVPPKKQHLFSPRASFFEVNFSIFNFLY